MKHAMREYPLYAVTTVTGIPVFPGDAFRAPGGIGHLVNVLSGPEQSGPTMLAVTDAPSVEAAETYGDETRVWTVRASSVGLLVTPYCPECGLSLGGDERTCAEFVVAHRIGGTCSWRHPDWSSE